MHRHFYHHRNLHYGTIFLFLFSFVLNKLQLVKMALAFQSGDTVKQALFEELQNILSADKDIRTNAEARIKHLEFTEGNRFCVTHAIGAFCLLA